MKKRKKKKREGGREGGEGGNVKDSNCGISDMKLQSCIRVSKQRQESPEPVSVRRCGFPDFKCLLKRTERETAGPATQGSAEMVQTPVATGRDQASWPSRLQDRRAPTPGMSSRVELEIRMRGAGREVPGPLHSPTAQEGRAGLASVYPPSVVSLPGGGNEALRLVKNQTIFSIQHENVPSPESRGPDGVTHWSPSPARRGCSSPGALQLELRLDRPGFRARKSSLTGLF